MHSEPASTARLRRDLVEGIKRLRKGGVSDSACIDMGAVVCMSAQVQGIDEPWMSFVPFLYFLTQKTLVGNLSLLNCGKALGRHNPPISL